MAASWLVNGHPSFSPHRKYEETAQTQNKRGLPFCNAHMGLKGPFGIFAQQEKQLSPVPNLANNGYILEKIASTCLLPDISKATNR